MLAPIETLLQEIAEKIEKVYRICGRTPVASPSPTESRAIIKNLSSIGRIVQSLPDGFKNRHRRKEWIEMAGWSAPNAFSSKGLVLSDLMDVKAVFDSVEPGIKVRAFSNPDIQSGIIASLDTWYEQISKDWFDQRTRTFIFISLTGFLAAIRGALIAVNYDLSTRQILVYCFLFLAILWIAYDIFWSKKIYRRYNYHTNIYYTYTDFFESASILRRKNIEELVNLLQRKRQLMMYQVSFWTVSVIFSIIATLTKL